MERLANGPPFLHQDNPNTRTGYITLNNERLGKVKQGKNGVVTMEFF